MKICTLEDLKDNWFPAECEHCGYRGCSAEWEGGHQIADTGDYSDSYCPKCGGRGCEETDNDQEQQDQRAYTTILSQRQYIQRLEDRVIDLTYKFNP